MQDTSFRECNKFQLLPLICPRESNCFLSPRKRIANGVECLNMLPFLNLGSGFSGASATRITQANDIKFDSYHNIYVCDSGNNRVQRFDLLHNGC